LVSNRKSGMTLTEIMIALMLLGLIIVVMLGVFVKGSYAIKKGRYRITALNLANQKIVEFNNIDLTLSKITRGDIVASIQNVQKVETGNPVRTSATTVTSDTDEIYIWNPTKEYKVSGVENIKGTNYDYTLFIETYTCDLNTSPTEHKLRKLSVVISWQKIEEKKSIEIRTLVVNPKS
jgi:prepilin-type N-terminal cleavage/methylation domain-containing protein